MAISHPTGSREASRPPTGTNAAYGHAPRPCVETGQQLQSTAVFLLIVISLIAPACSSETHSIGFGGTAQTVSGRTGLVRLEDGSQLQWSRLVTREGQIRDQYYTIAGLPVNTNEVRQTMRMAALRRRLSRGGLSDELVQWINHSSATSVLVEIWPALRVTPRRLNHRDETVCEEIAQVKHALLPILGSSFSANEDQDPCATPLLRGTITRDQLYSIAFRQEVAFIRIPPPVHDATYFWMGSVEFPSAHAAGVTGTGVSVAPLDLRRPHDIQHLAGVGDIRIPDGAALDHSTHCASFVRQAIVPFGSAPGVTIHFANIQNSDGTVPPGANESAFSMGPCSGSPCDVSTQCSSTS